MADTLTHRQRSKTMAAVRSKGNKSTEIRFAAFLRRAKLTGWRRQLVNIEGKPDFAFPKYKIAIFIDGCFWHKCPRCYREPKTKIAFWRAKVTRNRKRDLDVDRILKHKGWIVIRFWEHQMNNNTFVLSKLARIFTHLDLGMVVRK